MPQPVMVTAVPSLVDTSPLAPRPSVVISVAVRLVLAPYSVSIAAFWPYRPLFTSSEVSPLLVTEAVSRLKVPPLIRTVLASGVVVL
ncbi:hypothetical protein [Actinacidiphila oryziradicis]|uniref:Uncharacterized protein n=1 Tax=Actinacidiphila oryziradicis TaxID=2571141 RepID=A0A4U0SPK8_9ACTN|nr:hypothetical protein [Actinacidiphila oryziradicis]TKA11994.1 hypothetical protein FCI23_09325 [Actinacidiphila oryziradicis]